MKSKKISLIAILLFLISFTILIAGTFAAYTRAQYVKRVVASKNEATSFIFSSNYLYMRDAGSSDYPLRMIPISSQTDVDITVTVCNYLQSDLTRVNDETINYTFTAKLVDSNGESLSDEKLVDYSEMIYISGEKFGDDGIYTNTSTLTGGLATTHFYEITCSKENADRLKDICIQIQAVPSRGNQGKLVALLKLYSGTKSDTPWNGKFAEVTDIEMDTTCFDAFNYVISGTTQATMRLKWDENYVTLSPWSLEMLGNVAINSGDNNEKYIDISVGITDGSYTLQFYRTNSIPTNEKGEQVNNYVHFMEVK